MLQYGFGERPPFTNLTDVSNGFRPPFPRPRTLTILPSEAGDGCEKVLGHSIKQNGLKFRCKFINIGPEYEVEHFVLMFIPYGSNRMGDYFLRLKPDKRQEIARKVRFFISEYYTMWPTQSI